MPIQCKNTTLELTRLRRRGMNTCCGYEEMRVEVDRPRAVGPHFGTLRHRGGSEGGRERRCTNAEVHAKGGRRGRGCSVLARVGLEVAGSVTIGRGHPGLDTG